MDATIRIRRTAAVKTLSQPVISHSVIQSFSQPQPRIQHTRFLLVIYHALSVVPNIANKTLNFLDTTLAITIITTNS